MGGMGAGGMGPIGMGSDQADSHDFNMLTPKTGRFQALNAPFWGRNGRSKKRFGLHWAAKPLKWRSFYRNDLNPLVQADQKGGIRKSAVGCRRSREKDQRSDLPATCPPPVRHRLRLRRAGRVASYAAQASRAGVKGEGPGFAICDC